jgi:hypothetical protein
MVAGDRTAALIAVVGQKAVSQECAIFAESPRKLMAFDLRNRIASTQTKVHVYKSSAWTTPVIVNTKETARAIVQSTTMLVFVSASGVQIIGYDGRAVSRINDTRVKWDNLSADSVAASPSVVAPDGRKHVLAFSTSTGQMITSEPFPHLSEIRCVRMN